jgi:type II secretory pathway component GspD/PulD (secretin)
MIPLRLFPLLLAVAGASRLAAAEPNVVEMTPPTEERPALSLPDDDEMARLHALPACHIPLKGATLASAIRLLAQTAQMPYLAPNDDDFKERVTSDVMMNPYDLIKILAENYNFGMEYHDGIWRFYRINLNELVTKAYTLHFNNFQQVKISTSSINGQLASASGSNSPGAGGGGSGAPAGGVPAGGSGGNGEISATTGKIIEDIKGILAIDTVGTATPTLESSPGAPGAGAAHAPTHAPVIAPIWNPDTSQLFVVATRQQHSLIAAYLKTVDQPQKLIRIAVKFVETEHDPQSTVGIDWAGTLLGSGGPVTLNGVTSITPATASTPPIANGTTTTPLSTFVDLSHIKDTAFPAALLSVPALNWTMNAIASDRKSSVVQDPVIFTTNNKSVSFKATTQEPIQQGSTTFGSATAASTSSIAYIEVGTELTVLPSVLPGRGNHHEMIQMNLAINVSTIVGTQMIGGNPYPVTSSREYSYSVMIPNGMTLAIAGLQQSSRSVSDSKVPGLGDIPVLGYAFKNRNDSVQRSTLFAFITPEIVRSADDEQAAATAVPDQRHRVFQGTDTESLHDLDASLRDFSADLAALRSAATASNRLAVLNRLDRMDVELALMDVRLGELKLGHDRLVAPEAAQVERLRSDLASVRSAVQGIASD